MDKREAIELLKQALSEIPHLAELHFDNQEYTLWHSKIRDVLEAVFGHDSNEYQDFSHCDWQLPKIKFDIMDSHSQQKYLENLKCIETVILSIIQKYEILGIETKPTTMEDLPNAPQDYEDKGAIKELELILEGTPDMILECIRSTVEKLNSQGHTYGFRRTSGAPDYARWDKTYFATCAISQGNEGQIGTIKLQLLPKDQTLLSVPEPKDWDSYFGVFLSHLLTEFKRLGFVYFEEQKPPIGFKLSHREKDV